MRPLYVTSIATARRCWRRYAAKYLFKIKSDKPRDQSRSLGDEVHDLHERWNKLGESPVQDRSVADNLLLAGLPYLPPPKHGRTEGEHHLNLNGVTYALRRDWEGSLSQLPKGDSDQSLKIYGDIP